MANSITGPAAKLGRSALLLLVSAIAAATLTHLISPTGHTAGKDKFNGMVIGPQVDIDRAIPKLDALGVNTVRLRMSVRDWSRPSANTGTDAYDGALRQAPKLKDKGYRVVLQVASEGGTMPSYDRSRAVFQWLLTRPGAKSVDVVEVLGPVTVQDSDALAFSTTLSRSEQARRYVDGPLRAADDVFHKAQKKVLGAAFTPWQQAAERSPKGSWNLEVTKAYVAAGYLDRVDYAGFHPDVSTAADQEVWVRRAAALFGKKPIWVSEWRLNRQAFDGDPAYLAAMGTARSGLHGRLGAACYAGFTRTEGEVPVTRGGLGGYQEDDPAFGTYRDWAHG